MTATSEKWRVHKFGGTSVATAERYRAVAEIVRSEASNTERSAIVVSAMSKATDGLIELLELAKDRNAAYLERLSALKQRHLDTASELVGVKHRAVVSRAIESDFEDIREVLRGVWLVRSYSKQTLELISGYGELWSAQFLNATLQGKGLNSSWLDARQVLVVEPGETSIIVDWDKSRKLLEAWLASNRADWIVITGYIASTANGIPTTLKRNGSDYSASIFGALLDAASITIWTDVDGVLSADPKLVPEAVVLPDLSYQEATELAYFGAKVVHPSTMAPAIAKKIPIWIRNSFNQAHPGTRIHTTSTIKDAVKGFATVDEIALVNVEGTGMMGVPGVAQRLFGALKEVGISVIMISQGSSEHSICFAIPATQGSLARTTIERAFYAELQHQQIQTIDIAERCSILAAVGDGMAQRPGVAGRFLGALGRAGVNIRAIAQGSSERNISVVVERAQAARALRAVHSGFFLSDYTLSVGILGTGWIGSTLLAQLERAVENLRHESHIDLRVRGITDSKRMLLADKGLDLKNWRTELARKGEPLDLDRFEAHVRSENLPHAVLIDCTASEAIARRYEQWLNAGVHVITPNKKANTGAFEYYNALKNAARNRQKHYLYQTTVGGGLPIITTLRDLVKTGDRVASIEGVFSGTLSYIFNSFSADHPFSEVVRDAKGRGFTEPDPRDDLSGMDVARKVVILAREMGLPLELAQVKVQGLVPAELRACTVEEFMERLPALDQRMLQLLMESRDRGEILRYVGRISEDGSASVELKGYPVSHPFAKLSSTDNIVLFRTQRYSSQPLVVQGPGAGPEVTAGGVFADLLRLSSYLGAPL